MLGFQSKGFIGITLSVLLPICQSCLHKILHHGHHDQNGVLMVQVIFGDSSRFCPSWTFVHFYAPQLNDKGAYCLRFVCVCQPVSLLVDWLISQLVSLSVCLTVYQLIPVSSNFNLNLWSIQSTVFNIWYTCFWVQALSGDYYILTHSWHYYDQPPVWRSPWFCDPGWYTLVHALLYNHRQWPLCDLDLDCDPRWQYWAWCFANTSWFFFHKKYPI